MGLLHEDVGFMQQSFLRGDLFLCIPEFSVQSVQMGDLGMERKRLWHGCPLFAWKAVDFMPVDHVNLMIRGFSVDP